MTVDGGTGQYGDRGKAVNDGSPALFARVVDYLTLCN